MKRFKQTLLTEEAYYQLKEAKEILGKLTGRNVSFTEVVRQFVGKRLVMMGLDADVKDYILAFVDKITLNRHILGIILFGSVAKRAFTRFSDIDIAVITDSDFLDCLDYLNKEIKGIEDYQDRLIKKGLSLYINPLIITKKDIQKLNPIYFDIVDDGIVLYQRENTVANFFESLEKIKHKRINTASGQILTWG
ncbi:MAG: nucleotidyltransferase domain-containing protein [Candidatus Parvarchaeota archaeon]|nr:nucleotidyltransferase domain-containing protein [Candidatus Parvarchaeota archaeon]